MRYVLTICCLVLLIGCSAPHPKLTEEEKRRQEAEEARDQPREYKTPDGAFGTKDYANEAKESTDRDTRELEKAAEEAQ
ncbi:hypothetical protein L0222_25780 [bacterium]|nr:hypothetical protein [bacterium]MCI0601407.1 hypothetical protein [bacterium]